MKRTFKLMAKWIAIIAGTFTGLFLILCTLIVWFFTPGRLTPFVEKQASAYIDGELKVKRVELTFWKSFPKMTVEVNSLTLLSHSLGDLPDSVRATLPADADSLLSLASFRGGINVLPLMAGQISLYDVAFNSPRVNILQVTPDKANYDIFSDTASGKEGKAATKDDTGTSLLELPRISIERFTITDASPLRYRSIPDSTDMTLYLRNVDLGGTKAPLYTLATDGKVVWPLLEEYNFTSLTFNTDGSLQWDSRKPLRIEASDFTVNVDDFSALINTLLDFSGEPTAEKLEIKADGIPVEKALAHLPADLRKLTAPLKTDMVVNAAICLTSPWCMTDTILPSAEARLEIPLCHLDYENLKLREFETEFTAQFYGDSIDASVFTLKKLHARGAAVQLDLRARCSNILADPFIEGTFDGNINLNAIPTRVRRKINGHIQGRIDGHADFSMHLSDLNSNRFHRIYAKGDLRLRDIDANLENAGSVYLHEGNLAFGSNTSFIKDKAKVDSLLTLSIKADTLAAQAEGMSLQLKGLRAGVGSMNRASSGDTTEINPFGGRIAFERLAFDSQADTLRVRMRDARIGAALRRYEGNARIPQMNLSLGIGALQFGQALTKMALREASVEVTVHMRPQRRIFPDKMTAERRKAVADSIAALPVTKGENLSFPLDSADRNILRRWNFKGHVHAQSGRMITPAFPLRNTLTHVDLHFNQDSISLNNLGFKAGQSDFLLNGTVSNLRRAIIGRRGANLGVELTVSSDTININEIVQALFAGSAIEQQTDSAAVWADDDRAEDNIVAAADTVTSSGPVIIPHNIDARLSMRADHVLYSDLIMRDFKGDLLIYDGAVNLRDLSASTDVGRLDVNGLYSAPDPEDLQFGMGMRVSNFRLDKLTSIVPAIDSLLPVMENFAGIVNADVAVTTDLTPQMDIDIPSLRAAIKIEGDSLVLLDPDTFKTLSKWLMFRDKKKNYINHMAVEVVIENSTIELYPFMFDIDRYRLGVMGHNDMAMNLNYHISVLKSPLPFKFGINIKGTPDKMKIRTGGAKFKENMVGERQAIAANTRINIVQQMESVFKKGISKARLGALEMKGSEKVKSSKELLENFENEGLSVADSLRLIRQGLIENPDTLRFPVKALAD